MKSVLILACMVFVTNVMAEFVPPTIPQENEAICHKTLCDKLGTWGCRNSYNNNKVADACSRQIDLQCISKSFHALSDFETNDLNEVTILAKSCQYSQSKCIQILASGLSKFERDDLVEVRKVNDACRLANPACVTDIMKRVGRFHKDDLFEVVAIGRACQGTYEIGCIARRCKELGKYRCDEFDELKRVAAKCVDGPSRSQRRRL